MKPSDPLYWTRGYHDFASVFGFEVGGAFFENVLSQYDLGATLKMLGQIDSYLFHKNPVSPDTHAYLAGVLFEPSDRKRAHKRLEEDAGTLLFPARSLFVATRLAARYCPVVGGRPYDDRASTGLLGKVILATSGLARP